MSLASKLVSAALTVGTAAAVGYGLKKLGDKVEKELLGTPETQENDEIIGTADSKIKLKCEQGKWHYAMREKGIVKERKTQSGGKSELFDFAALKDGVTELEFDFQPENAAGEAKTITYNIEVKNGKIIRCDAAGDLEMIEK